MACYAALLVFPVVVVDVVPADVPAEQAQVMIDACSGAVPSGACALASASPESVRPDAVALVLWQGPGQLLATVRVGRRNGEWVTRQLAFSDADPPRDRWVAAGLTIATLLDETRSAAAPVASGEPASSGPAKGGDDGPAAARPHGIGLGVGALLGNGWDHGGPMAGFWATLSLGLLQQRFFALAGASYAFSSGPDLAVQGQLNSRWLSLELGAGVQRRLATVRLFAAPELAYQSVSVTPGSGAAGTDGELQLKLRAGAAWEVTSHFGLCLGAAGRILPVENPASDPNRARRSGLIGEAFAGVELRL